MNLVCVDREKLTLGILSARFNHLKWQTRFARSAIEALALVHAEKPDVLVTEIQLEASNGYSLIREVRRDEDWEVARLPILILSHMGQISDIMRGLGMGANGYVTKPFDLARLESDIEALARNNW